MHRLGWMGLVAGVALLSVACSSDDGGTSGGEAGSSAAGSTSSAGAGNAGSGGSGAGATGGSPSAGSGGTSTAGQGGSAGASEGGSGGQSSSASLEGQIGRTARIPDGLDGIGNVYIAVFADNPVTNMNAEALANALIMDADLSMDGTGVSYRVDNIPVSNEARYVVAFMDDDGNVTPESPSPKKPDLIAFDGLSPIKVTLASPGVTKLDLVLNAEIPF